jgi:hypothetical protein
MPARLKREQKKLLVIVIQYPRSSPGFAGEAVVLAFAFTGCETAPLRGQQP